MTHPLVAQLRFARSEFRRGLEGVSEEEAQRRFLPMNCISWNVGHLAWQEQRYWLFRAQGKLLTPELNERFAYGAPASTPPLGETWRTWETVTAAADPWLDGVTMETLSSNVEIDGKPSELIFGSLLHRMIYHYWYHTGENAAIRQQLGHSGLPDFVGDIDHEAPYRPEAGG
jgi:DinB family protein